MSSAERKRPWHDKSYPSQRRRINLPVPQWLRCLRVGHQTQWQRQRKYVYGKTREQVHSKWLTLQQRARQGPVATSVPALGSFLTYWLDEVVKPNLAPLTHATYETFVRLYITPDLGPND